MAWLHAVGIGVVACVAACGPVVGQPGAEGDEGTMGETGQDTGAEVSTRGSSGADGADATTVEGDESDTGDRGTMLCGASDPAQPLAVLSGGTTAAVLHGDGSVMPLALPDPMAPADASVYPSVTARGDRIAVVWSWSVLDDGVQYGSHLAVFSAAGELLWTHAEPNAAMSAAHVGDDGSLVVSRSPTGGTNEGVVLLGPDEEIGLPEFMPTGPLRGDGWIRGHVIAPEGNALPGWMTSDLAWQGLRESALQTWQTRAGDAFVYLAHGDDVPALVVDTPAEATVLPLPTLAGIDEDTLFVQASPDVAWLLVHDDGDRWWRIAVADGTTEELALVPPDGETTLECYQPEAVIDDGGRVLLSTRDASSAAVLRHDPERSAWAAMGERVTNVDDMSVVTFGETALVHSAGSGETFCPPQMYERGTTKLAGTTQQLVRAVDGYARVLPADSWANVDPSGVCAALITAEGMSVIDLPTDQEIDIPEAQLVTWWTR